MALSVTGFSSSALSHKVVYESSSGTTANTDVTGTSGTIISMDLDNNGSTYASHIKFKLTSGAITVGTTEADFSIQVGASKKVTIDFPNPLAFEQLSFWTTRNGETSDTTAPETTLITILCT